MAERMDQLPNLKVIWFLNIQRRHGDRTKNSEILREFTNRFKTKEWPGNRLPEVYYDPRSLEMDSVKRSSMHAKCIVVDNRIVFVSSANFTEAAQERNLEVGLLIHSTIVAEKLTRHFDTLLSEGFLQPVS